MTDIEERYELPEGLIDFCLELEREVLDNNGKKCEVPGKVKREWFNIAAKPNSSASVVEDFLQAISDGAKGKEYKLFTPFFVSTKINFMDVSISEFK